MKSDISRSSFDARKHYSKVVMQQGRVQLDADWNEQQDILLHHLETRTGDVIGASGASIGESGFAIEFTPDWNDLIISPGSLYVDGILCELDEGLAVPTLTVDTDTITLSFLYVDIDNPPFQKDHWAELLNTDGQRIGLFKITGVSLDRDRQIVTLSIEQATFKIPDDTSGSLSYLVRPVVTYMTQPNYPSPEPSMSGLLGPDVPGDQNIYLVFLDVWQREITTLDDPDIHEVALGGADTAQRSQTLWQVEVMPIPITGKDLLEAIKDESKEKEGGRHPAHIRKMSRLLRVLSFTPPISTWNSPLPGSTGRLSVRTTPNAAGGSQGYSGLENQLYHVEIHMGTAADSKPTFKWARDNASLFVMAMVDDSGLLTILGNGQGSLLGLKVGQYVELINDFMQLREQPGHLSRIQQVDDITGQITLVDPPDALKGQQVKLRLWNGSSSIDSGQNPDDANYGWIALENGIEVRFLQNGTYRSGDYWLIPARTATGQLEWPHTAPQPPMNAPHRYARLACLLHTQVHPLVQDCRQQIYPLGAKALHIIDINWKNDAFEPRIRDEHTRKERNKLQTGLRFTLDGEPDQECVGAMQAAITVSLETALPGGGSGIFLINGIVEIEGNIIEWHWDKEEKMGLFARFLSKYDKWLHDWFDEEEHYMRVRVTMKGHYIWQTVNGRRLYLDGQTFGIPGSEDTLSGHKPLPGKQPGRHIDLWFPSGTGRPASDFESWFYIQEEGREDERKREEREEEEKQKEKEREDERERREREDATRRERERQEQEDAARTRVNRFRLRIPRIFQSS